MAFKLFAEGAVLSATDLNEMMRQVTVEVANAAERDALPIRPRTVYRVDKEWAERYFPLFNATTTPKGVKTPGWYPIDNLPTFVGEVLPVMLTINVEYQLGATSGAPAVPMVEREDFENWRNPSTNPSRLTPNYEGFYRLTVLEQWDSNSGGVRQLRVRKNGTYVKAGQPSTTPDSPFIGHKSSVFYMEMNGTTDYVEVGVIHSATANLNFSAIVHMEYVRPIHHD